MKGMTLRAIAFATAALFLALSATALADGPAVGGWAEGGVAAGSVRYVALPSARRTVLERLAVKGGQPLRTRWVNGQRGIPMVATDGTAGGISGDGQTLVLSAPRA